MIQDLWKKINPSGFVFRYYLATFFAGLMFYIAVLVPFYTQWGHISLVQVQTLQSWLMIWMFILNIPTGVIADHIGRKISMSLGGLFLAASCVIYILGPSFYVFLIAEFIAALGSSFVIGASSALIYDFLKQNNRQSESRQIMGRSSAIGSLGTVIAAPIGSLIAANLGLTAPMLLSAIPLFAASLVILTVHESKNLDAESHPSPLSTIKKGVGFLFQSKNLQHLVANDILLGLCAYFLIWLYQPMLIKVGLAIIFFGWIRSGYSLAGMLATFDLKVIERLFGSGKNFVNLTALIVSACFILIAAFPSVITVTIAIILVGGLATARSSYLNTTMNEFIPTEQRATVLSATSTVYMLVFALSNPIVGYIADHSLRIAFLGIGLLPLIAFIFLRYSPVPNDKTIPTENTTNGV